MILYKILFFTIFCCFSSSIQGQQCKPEVWKKRLDSLQLSFQKEITGQAQFYKIIKDADQCFLEHKDSLIFFKTRMLEIDYLNREAKHKEALSKIFEHRIDKKIVGISSASPALAADIYYVWAYALQDLGKLEEALEKMKLSADNFEKVADYNGITDACLSAAEFAFRNNMELSVVKKFFLKAEQTATKHLKKSDPLFATLYQTAAAIFYEEANNFKAIEYAEKGLQFELGKTTKDDEQIGGWYKMLSVLHAEELDNNQALIYAMACIPYFEKLSKPYMLIDLYGNICELNIFLDRKKESLEYFNKCKELSKKTGWNPKAEKASGLYSYKSLGSCYLKLNRADELISYLQPLIPDIENYNLKPDEAYKLLGRAYEEKGDFKKAEHFLQRTLEISKKRFGVNGKKLAHNYYFLSDLYAKNNDWDRCLKSLDTLFHMLALPTSGNEAIDFEHVMGHRTLTYAFEQRGKAYSAKEMFKEAHQDYEFAISLLHYLKDNYASDASKHFTLETLRPLYEAASHAALQLQKSGDSSALTEDFKNLVFEYAEHSKATLLNESIIKFRSHFHESVGIPDSVIAEEENMINTIEKHRELLYGAQQINDSVAISYWQDKILLEQRGLDAFESNLDSLYPNYKNAKNKQHKIASISDIQAILDSASLLVEYFISEHTAYIFYISKDKSDVKIIEDHSLMDLRSHIRELRTILTDTDYIQKEREKGFEIFTERAFYLFEKYLNHPLLKNKSKLIIIPDREFNYIPFEVLLTENQPQNSKTDYAVLPYLIKSYSIRYEYSATVMANHEKNTKHNGNGRILGFAPLYEQSLNYDSLSSIQRKERTPKEVQTHKNLKNLVGAKKELQMIQTWSDGDFYYGADATERTFKQIAKNNYSVVHLASHGVVDLDHPSYSSLVFSEDLDSVEDNILYAYEINHLDFRNIELVVLSACETGYGKYAHGEGVVSLGRSFMYAGVSSIVSTLWELNDQSSVELMKIFYRNLSKGMPKDEALRAAKLEYLKQHPGISAHPFFWAGIVQIGDPAPIRLHYNSGLEFLAVVLIAMFACLLIGLWLLYKNKKAKQSEQLPL
jgi:CHAT domain-containing protein